MINNNKLITTSYGQVSTCNALSNEGIETMAKFGSHYIHYLLEGYNLEIEKKRQEINKNFVL